MKEALSRWSRIALHPAWLSVLTDLFVLAYAAFSVVSQLTSIAHGTPRVLLPALLAIAAGVFLLVAYAVARRPSWVRAYLADAEAEPVRPRFAGAPMGLPLRVASSALVALLVVGLTRSTWLGWVLSLVLALAAATFAFRATAAPAGSDDEREHEPWWSLAVVIACALVAVAIALLVVRPRSDDAFYSAMALSVISAPDLPLLAVNSMHGPASELLRPQIMFVPYRVHSFEVLGGTLSLLFGVEPMALIHLVLGPLFALLAPFAIARGLRQLTPAWAIGVLAVTAFYCIEGTASVGFANHAFVRMFHGKSVLLSVGVPLLIAHGLRFGAAPSKLRFLLLAATQITAVGLSSTGIWLAPVIAMVAVWAATPSRGELGQRTLGAVAASAYVLAIGMWVAFALRAVQAASEALPADASEPQEQLHGIARLAEAAETALGSGRTALGLLAIIALALAASRAAAAFRFFAGIGLVTALFATPFASDFVGADIVGQSTYHRVFWLLPIPFAFGVGIAELSQRLHGRWPLRIALAGALAAGAVWLLLITKVYVLSEANHASFVYPPALKIGPRARGAALEACSRAGKGSYILASSSVSEQVATLRNCGYPILTDARWLDAPPAELHAREELVRYVSTSEDVPLDRAQWFQQALARYKPRVVVMLEEAMKNRRTKLLLRRAGYEKAEQLEGNHVWMTSSPWQRSEQQRVTTEICQRLVPGTIVLAPYGISGVLEARGCMPSLLHQSGPYDAHQDTIAQFERALSSDSELTDIEKLQLAAVLKTENVGAVVVAPQGMGNGSLRSLLRDIDYHNIKITGGYRVFALKSAKVPKASDKAAGGTAPTDPPAGPAGPPPPTEYPASPDPGPQP